MTDEARFIYDEDATFFVAGSVRLEIGDKAHEATLVNFHGTMGDRPVVKIPREEAS